MRVRPSLLGLHHVALNVRDVALMKRFYVEVLGFRVEWEPDAENVYLTSGTDNLALHAAAMPSTADEERRAPDAQPGQVLDHLGLIVPTPADVDAWAAYLQDHGVRIDGPPRTHRDGARSLYVRDPETNRVQIIYHPPISDRK